MPESMFLCSCYYSHVLIVIYKSNFIRDMVDTLATLALLKNKTSSVPGDGIGNGLGNGFVVNYNGFGSEHLLQQFGGEPAHLFGAALCAHRMGH